MSVTELDQEDRVFKLTESGGSVGFKKAAASLKDWGSNPQIWTGCFLTYLAIMGYLVGEKHPKAVPNLLMFIRQILDYAQTYEWSEAVLPLALNFHQYILDKGDLSMENTLITALFREKYLPHNLTLPAKSTTNPSARSRQTRSTRSSNNETVVCDKFNTSGCLWEGCKRRHECTLCGLSEHGASSCRSDPTGPFDEVYNRITDYLHIPRNTEKDQQGTRVTVLGIQIDSITMETRLPPEKLCRATLDAAAALNATSLSLKQTERLTGSLAFCSRVVRLGRTRLQSLYTFQAAFPRGKSARRRISQRAVKPDTALADLAALRAYHIDNFLDDKLFDNKHFRRLIDGARRLNPISKARVRKPVSRDTITKLSAGLAILPSQPLEMTANLLDDLNFATACRVAFAGFLRLGEFTYKTEDLKQRSIFLATKLTRSDIRFSSSLDHAQLTLKRTKTDRHHEGVQIILAKTGDRACPVDALQKLLILDPRGPDAPLFSFHRRPSSRNNFLSTLSTKLKALGIQAEGYSGHSFRKGAAQHAHDSGIPDDQIQVLGRWTSEAFRVYFTTNASVLYKLNRQFQTGSPAPLSLLLPPPSPPPS
ncbi:hypothetical protein N7478_010091 [Penicillium angulare]|uniref:uncharacterized protein n=1 Tax=Penicillium angulare TaxID=116970 RepID=UPI002540F2A2|nr:uncharacterized protein N7478_010091 [Penicillium angulare]KAJ5267283.1 hypothetical protein N7478_010091 [Penicillium angulare]